ncbi:MAG: DoxX family protein [Spirosomataceae bacterium]
MKTTPFYNPGTAIIRIITGLLMTYHGFEVFDSKLMNDYAQWDMFKDLPFGLILVYLGKGAELVAGVLLTLGWYTQWASAFMALTMLSITFFVGHGKFWYEDQHPFLFVLLAMLFYFNGAGSWSLDAKLKDKKG